MCVPYHNKVMRCSYLNTGFSVHSTDRQIFPCTMRPIILGFTLDVDYSQKLIGFGVVAIFFVVFPLFSYHHWKGKDPKDYMITHENLERMKNSQKRK